MSHDAKWEAIQAKALIGLTIVNTVITPSGDSFGLVLTRPEWEGGDIVVWVLSDREGNDCGSLSMPKWMPKGNRKCSTSPSP
jgi:hypothetical protein